MTDRPRNDVKDPASDGASKKQQSSSPSITLPKGGGAIRGIGEKFTANPATGTGTMSVPIATSRGRPGLGPEISLSYDSGTGNGPFGLGWSLSTINITRKTDKGLPQYRDADESDVFVFGAEDLVPVLDDAGERFEDTTRDPGYSIHRYRPRIEAEHTLVERWTRRSDGDVHWRSLSRDNILTLYGKDARARIVDPRDPTRVFTWLICETRDDKGNAIVHDYKAEDAAGVDLANAHERNRGDRGDARRAVNRYLARIRYGNRTPLLDGSGARPWSLTDGQLDTAGWMFEVVFDYGEHDLAAPTPRDPGTWRYRPDPFSSYRAGFEVRTTRLCRRVLMFHHFRGEPGVGEDCLVRSIDFTYSDELAPADERNPSYSCLRAITQCGYVRDGANYHKRTLPQLDLEYVEPVVQARLDEIDDASLENLPVGLDGVAYQWTDLHGEGIPGIVTEQAGAWFYKRNISPISERTVELAPLERVRSQPNFALGAARFMDLAGDGLPDLVALAGPTPGFYEHDDAEGWSPFRPFVSRLDRDPHDPNLKLIDLDGDGRADVLVSEDDAFVWHPSLGEAGFGDAQRIRHPIDEEDGPRLVFTDGTESIYLADFSGDGLTDLVRVRNGEVCYWPNLGHGRFGAKVTMDGSPHFERPDAFDQRRVRLADIDGSGTTDLIYLHPDGVRLYFNQSGNAWSKPHVLTVLSRIDDVVDVEVVDLLGNGTMCLVWSSSLPGDTRRRVRYVDLMGGKKPHLLARTVNNLGAETRVDYVTSTKFYLHDKYAGTPWITKLPFPIQVVDRVVAVDAVSGNRFTTRYRYHHGYFDGEEREFRGFGMVEQEDSEELATLTADGTLLESTNLDPSAHVPPVLTRTWFHTGIYLGRDRVADFHAGEYFREPGSTDVQTRLQLLPDTVLPADLTLEEERECCRALKGRVLRREVYALDGSTKASTPYRITEQNFTIVPLQYRGNNRHAVFFVHAREAIETHYERDPTDPRVHHTLTLEVDAFGNPLRELAIAYGRRVASSDPAFTVDDRAKQRRRLLSYTEHQLTAPISTDVSYRAPLTAESRVYELTGFDPEGGAERFAFAEWTRNAFERLRTATEIPFEQVPSHATPQKRIIKRNRTLYRKDDLTGLSPPGVVETLALPGERYDLAFTDGLLASVLVRRQQGRPDEPLLVSPAPVLLGTGPDEGGYIAFDGGYWIPSGRTYLDPAANVVNPAATAAAELALARQHFYLARKTTDAFGHSSVADYDSNDLLVAGTTDAVGNTVLAENDYRVLQPKVVTDANRNRTAVAFDALGNVVATAVMGKPGEPVGDLLEGFVADPPLVELQAFAADPDARAMAMLGKATTRIVYDVGRFLRTRQPMFASTLSRETHVRAPGGATSRIQIAFGYSDGFGREVQQKVRAEPGDAPRRQPATTTTTGDAAPGELVRDSQGVPVLAATTRRWIGTGRTVFNNKGKPVKQYEPFFSSMHLYETERDVTDNGVSPVLFYDPADRVVATLRPDHTFDKAVIGAWQSVTYDVNDTVAPRGLETGDPRTDPDIAGYVREYFAAQGPGFETWYAQRIANQLGAAELDAARRAEAHAATPTIAHFDPLGRPFLTIVRNRYERNSVTIEEDHASRVELDITGNQRAVADAKQRVVTRLDLDLAARRLRQATMDAGERWMLADVAGKPIRAWDSRRFVRRLVYDELRRQTELHVGDASGVERLAERVEYGETRGDAQNHKTRVYRAFDAAGILTSVAYDFKGNLLGGQRDLLPTYDVSVDWRTNPLANDGTFTTSTSYDALNRPVSVIAPDASVQRSTFNEAGLLETVEVELRGATVATPFVTKIDYDARRRRTGIDYANGASTTYEYDRSTLRLTRLRTTRPATPDATVSQLFQNAAVVQDLRYTYDPVGNPTRIEDGALRTIFRSGQRVEPVCRFTYDAVYRLIEASGREHEGQGALDFSATTNHRDQPFVGIAHPNDLQALRNYLERYEYDVAGNIEVLRHLADGSGWTRSYDYEEESLLETGKQNNRLTRTTLGNGATHVEPITHDAHGNIVAMPPVAALGWNFEDKLERADLGGGGLAYYVHDASGRRTRKVITSRDGVRRKERISLGGFEVYREFAGGVDLERTSLHVMDDKQRIALVETLTIASGNRIANPSPSRRYQLGGHLDSTTLELDAGGALISHEEYHPYGTTAVQAGRSAGEVALKRYRYIGKERDEETGLCQHDARCYAPWLLRWTSADPLDIKDGPNVYAYGRDNPIRYLDPDGTECSERDISGCPQGSPPPPVPQTGTQQASAEANSGAPPDPPPPPAPPARPRTIGDLASRDFPEAVRDSSEQFQLRGGVLAPQYRAPSYPVTGTDLILPSLGRAFRVAWDEHPQLRADVLAFGTNFWNQYQAAIITGGVYALGVFAAVAGAGRDWGPLSLATGMLPVVFPELTFRLPFVQPSHGDLAFRQGAFRLPASTAIGTNEGENVVGAYPTLAFRGEFLDRPIDFTFGVNLRYLPDLTQFRLQESLGANFSFAQFRLGQDYRASITAEGRASFYQQFDLTPTPTATSLTPEATFMINFRIFELPARR